MITFSTEVKNALCESCMAIKKKCCRRAVYHGYMTYRRSTKPTELQTALVEKLEKENHGDMTEVSLDEIMSSCPNCQKSYVEGMFIACGSVTNPDSSSYQLEMRVTGDENVERLTNLLEELGMPPKTTERSGSTILYYKDSESIEDFLNFIGAQKAAFSVMNAKILKDLRNNANRLANCDAANIDKTISAAQLQIHAVERLLAAGKLSSLPPELEATANLRLENPEATLGELARLHNPPITKSGVNHRLKKLIEFSEALTEE